MRGESRALKEKRTIFRPAISAIVPLTKAPIVPPSVRIAPNVEYCRTRKKSAYISDIRTPKL